MFSFSTRGERHNFYYADCSYIVLQSTPSWTARPRVKISTHFWTAQPRVKILTNWPNKRAAHPKAPNWTGLAQSQISTDFWTARPRVKISTNCFFQKSPKISAPPFRAWRHLHPSPISYLGFLLWHLWLSYPLRASVNCTQCVHLHLH